LDRGYITVGLDRGYIAVGLDRGYIMVGFGRQGIHTWKPLAHMQAPSLWGKEERGREKGGLRQGGEGGQGELDTRGGGGGAGCTHTHTHTRHAAETLPTPCVPKMDT
jgi:hypothetical protein